MNSLYISSSNSQIQAVTVQPEVEVKPEVSVLRSKWSQMWTAQLVRTTEM